MSALWLAALFSYSAQLAALVAAAAITTWLFRIRSPRPALWFWNSVLVSTVLLPAVFAWQSDAGQSPSSLVQFGALSAGIAGAESTWSRAPSLLLGLVAAVAALRLAWVGLGLMRLGTIRRRSEPLSPAPPFVAELSAQLNTSASIHISDDVECPVTLGIWAPLVLLPRRALALPSAVQQAIVCHELVHVQRRDWLQTLLEQMWGSLLWFHPAAHLLLSRVGLMREAVVDQATIAMTGNRRAYAQALLAFAEPAFLSPLPVMHLIKPRHLSRRITLIAQEVRMSRRHSAVALASALVLVSVTTGATATRFPIVLGTVASIAQVYKPGDGVTLPRVIKDVKPQYTSAAMEQKIQGDVWMQTVISASGEPSEITITRSLDAQYGLDEAAIQALSQWRFEPGRKDGKPVPVQVTIEMRFTLK